MSRQWDAASGTWHMQCDKDGCTTQSETFANRPDLTVFRDRGWFIARLFGDRCPACVASAGPITVPPFDFTGVS